MNAKALLVLLLVAACVAGWFALQAGSADLVPSSSTAEKVGPAPAQAATALGQVDPPTNAAPLAAGLERTAVPGADVGKAPDQAKSVVVRGRLVDRNATPRSGIGLRLASWSMPEGLDGDDFEVFSDGEPSAGGRPTTTTRADGRFELALAVDRSGTLSLPDDDLVFADEAPRVRGKKGDQDLGDVVVVRASALQGVVRDQGGQPVADVSVSATVDAFAFGATSKATTAADGSFSVGKLRPGRWTLRTASGRFLPTVEEFTLAPEQRQTDLVVVVLPGHAIAGQVVDDRGLPVVGFKVGSKRKEARGAVDIERFAMDEAATTDHYGFFTLSGLAEQVATLKAFGPGHTTATIADVPVGTGNLLVRVERLAIIEGVLQATDGTPIEGSRVVAQGSNANGPGAMLLDVADDLPLGNLRANATTGADGSFRVESVAPGAVTMIAQGKSHRPAKQAGVNVLPGQTIKGIRLVADRGATAKVKVVDETGKPVARAKVRVERARDEGTANGMRFTSRAVAFESETGDVSLGGDPEAIGWAETDAEGLALVTGLPAGNATVKATHADFAPARAVQLTLPRVGAVDATVALQMPGFAEISVLSIDGAVSVEDRVRVTGPAEGGRDGADSRGTTGADGLTRVGPLAPGEYTARLTRASTGARFGDAMVFSSNDEGSDITSSARRFTVVAGQTTRVELRRPVLTKVHGVVTGVDGPVPACSVELAKSGEGSFDLAGFGNRSVKTSADGSFVLEDVESGSYTLRYGKSEQVVKASAPIEVPPNVPELRQDLALRTGKLRVQVCTLGTGEAIVGAEVEVEPASQRGATEAPRQERRVMMVSVSMSGAGEESTSMTMGAPRACTDEDGWAEVEDVPVGEYTLKVRHKKHAPGKKEGQVVVERQTTECGRIELGVAGQIRGKVLTADGKPAGMAFVQNRLVGTESWSESEMAMGGTFRLTGLPAGKYLVRGQQMSGSSGAYTPEVEIEVKSGETATAELRLPPE